MTDRKLTRIRSIKTGEELASYDPIRTSWETVTYSLAVDVYQQRINSDDFSLKDVEGPDGEIYEFVGLDGDIIGYLDHGWQQLANARAAAGLDQPVMAEAAE